MAIATKQKPRTSPVHKKRVGTHQKRSQRFNKTYWPYLPIALVIAVGIFFNHSLSGGVLSYATNTSPDGLLASTNVERVSNGAGAITINQQLTSAAQAKADDMAARNYWSHNTPDGQEPWVFVRSSGYTYQAVGENLAYGFGTSEATVAGWMNSPTHRANMLNSNYTEVGFGIANSANYQQTGGQTIVVAMYGRPAGLPVAAGTNPEPSESAGGNQPIQVSAVVPEREEQKIARVQIATSGSAPWSVFAVTVLLVGLLLALITRHSVAWHRALVRGEQFILTHKVLDVAIVSGIMIAFILTRTAGVIQ